MEGPDKNLSAAEKMVSLGKLSPGALSAGSGPQGSCPTSCMASFLTGSHFCIYPVNQTFLFKLVSVKTQGHLQNEEGKTL